MTRGRWLALGASATLCAIVMAMTRYVRPVQFVGDAELVALVGERIALAGYDDRTCSDQRRQVSAIPAAHATPAVRAGIKVKLGPGWQWEERGGKATLARVHPRLHDWSTIVATVELLQAQPGVTLTALEIATTGTRTHRALVRAAIEISWSP
ncbi:MAG: hypothetical protein EXS38_07975 [Opitutus sp.]|nr:hypothetical protein [Opitutus sp.]